MLLPTLRVSRPRQIAEGAGSSSKKAVEKIFQPLVTPMEVVNQVLTSDQALANPPEEVQCGIPGAVESVEGDLDPMATITMPAP